VVGKEKEGIMSRQKESGEDRRSLEKTEGVRKRQKESGKDRRSQEKTNEVWSCQTITQTLLTNPFTLKFLIPTSSKSFPLKKRSKPEQFLHSTRRNPTHIPSTIIYDSKRLIIWTSRQMATGQLKNAFEKFKIEGNLIGGNFEQAG
jgi:hypothetical protein